MQAPPDGSVVKNDVAVFEQAIPEIAKGEPGDIVAESIVSEASPISETVSVWLPSAPPKPRLPAENSATGAATLISGVTVSLSVTVIVSLSVTMAGANGVVTVTCTGFESLLV